MNSYAEKNLFEEKFKSNVITPTIEKMLLGNYSYLPKHLGESELTKTVKFSRDLPIYYDTQAIAERFKLGMQGITRELTQFLDKEEMEKIYYEWFYGLEKCILVYKLQKEDLPNKAVVPCEQIGITETTMSHFYEAGARLFKNHEYEKAANAFFVLTILDYRRYNVWLSFGLSAQQAGDCEAALYGYAMASVNAVDSPFPYVYSAECAIKMGQKEDAEKYLSMAEEALRRAKMDTRGHLADYINKIRHQLHSKA